MAGAHRERNGKGLSRPSTNKGSSFSTGRDLTATGPSPGPEARPPYMLANKLPESSPWAMFARAHVKRVSFRQSGRSHFHFARSRSLAELHCPCNRPGRPRCIKSPRLPQRQNALAVRLAFFPANWGSTPVPEDAPKKCCLVLVKRRRHHHFDVRKIGLLMAHYFHSAETKPRGMPSRIWFPHTFAQYKRRLQVLTLPRLRSVIRLERGPGTEAESIAGDQLGLCRLSGDYDANSWKRRIVTLIHSVPWMQFHPEAVRRNPVRNRIFRHSHSLSLWFLLGLFEKSSKGALAKMISVVSGNGVQRGAAPLVDHQNPP